jgi:hypothetical protein
MEPALSWSPTLICRNKEGHDLGRYDGPMVVFGHWKKNERPRDSFFDLCGSPVSILPDTLEHLEGKTIDLVRVELQGGSAPHYEYVFKVVPNEASGEMPASVTSPVEVSPTGGERRTSSRRTKIAMRRNRRVAISICAAVSGMLAVAVWSESQATSILSGAALDHARQLEPQKASTALRAFEVNVSAERTSHAMAARYAAGIVVLSFASVVMLWVPRQRTTA